VRRIVRDAGEHDYQMSSFLLGVVLSEEFRMKKAPEAATEVNALTR